MPVTGRPLQELRALYQVRPHERDVIVEGRTDVRLIRWYLAERGLRALVHAVDDRAEVPSGLVLRHGGEVGPRGRVIGFAHQADEWELQEPTVTFIIDSDRDCLLEKRPVRPDNMLLTDYGSMDVYMLQDRPFNQCIRVILGRTDDAEALRNKLTPALNDLCVVRTVLHWSGLGIELVKDFAASCRFSRDSSSLDAEDLLNRTLSKQYREYRDSLLEQVEIVRTRIPEDRLMAVRGHDMSAVVIRALGIRNVWANEDTLEQAWRGCLQVSDLDHLGLFVQLSQRLSEPGTPSELRQP